jgi:putative membrane protein
MDPSLFPPINAALNGLATVFLLLALFQIKRGDRKGHARSMISALVVSAVFLACYLTHKVLLGHANTPFPGDYPVIRRVYLAILFTHIPLAIGMLPLIFIALKRALRGDFDGHRRIVKAAYPIWLYVSVTGVLIYFMLYQWFPPVVAPAAAAVPGAAAATAGEPAPGGALVFEPEEFAHQAAEGETEFTATFVAKNTGTAPVTLTKLDSSCSCLKVEADTGTIAPGASATITAVFDIAKLSGESEKSVFVTTDIPGSRESRLAVKVSVPAIAVLEPNMITWPQGGGPAPREAVFRVLRDKPIRVLEVSSSRDSVSVEWQTVEEGREYRIVLKPQSTDAIQLGIVRITTDCELEEHRQQLLYFAVQDPATAKEG